MERRANIRYGISIIWRGIFKVGNIPFLYCFQSFLLHRNVPSESTTTCSLSPASLRISPVTGSLLSFRDCRIDCASSRDMILSLCLGYGVPFGGRSRLKPRRSLRSLLSLQQVARLLFEAASVTIEGLAEPSLVRAPVRPRQYQP